MSGFRWPVRASRAQVFAVPREARRWARQNSISLSLCSGVQASANNKKRYGGNEEMNSQGVPFPCCSFSARPQLSLSLSCRSFFMSFVCVCLCARQHHECLCTRLNFREDPPRPFSFARQTGKGGSVRYIVPSDVSPLSRRSYAPSPLPRLRAGARPSTPTRRVIDWHPAGRGVSIHKLASRPNEEYHCELGSRRSCRCKGAACTCSQPLRALAHIIMRRVHLFSLARPTPDFGVSSFAARGRCGFSQEIER